MIERFPADRSRFYRVSVEAAPLLGFPLALLAGGYAGLELPWLLVWPVAVTFALLSQRWIMLHIRYELAAGGLTVVYGLVRTHLAWDEIEQLRGSRHRALGVDGFTLLARDGRMVDVAPHDRGAFVRAVATRAPHVRLDGDPQPDVERDAARQTSLTAVRARSRVALEGSSADPRGAAPRR